MIMYFRSNSKRHKTYLLILIFVSRSIVSFAQNLSSNKDVKEVFVQLVEKPIEAFKSIGASPATVDLFLRAYGDVIKDNTVLVDSDVKCLIGKFMRTARPAILAIYEWEINRSITIPLFSIVFNYIGCGKNE